MPSLTGAFAPVSTPLTRGDRVSADALRIHLQWLAEQGLHGALILGSNGEFPSFTLAERQGIAEAAARHNHGLALLLNIGSCALVEAQEMADVARLNGYMAALCPPPWYWRDAPLSGLVEFYRRILDYSKVPVLLYHIPQVTGVAISDELLDAIGQHENLAGIKDSSGSEAEMDRLLPRFTPGAYFVGHDRLIARCIERKGSGSISACANVVPALVKAIYSQPQEQAKLNSVRGILEKFGLGAAVKAILRRKGIGEYWTRPPMAPLSDIQAEELYGMLNMLGAVDW
jgi:4-hydroxy-tetrahydrodipicolinate synthase